MDLDDQAGHGPGAASSTPTRASDRGAERLGFTGTARRPAAVAADAAGLTMLAGDEFGSGPTTPLMPSTWAPDESDAAGSR
ncbi:hypothetical protein [Mycobacterium sp. Z3061]|uniref:PPW family C-terminal domain-containing PPE protein n=1 Tax=Mycobacterium sp. Z3061 TaxID=3073562 RepID=UPI002873A45E|nr:hypothetical protein [Mycobacterium sp. Z3061]